MGTRASSWGEGKLRRSILGSPQVIEQTPTLQSSVTRKAIHSASWLPLPQRCLLGGGGGSRHSGSVQVCFCLQVGQLVSRSGTALEPHTGRD